MWRKEWQQHKGKLVGVAAGLFFGCLYLIVGLWDMLVVLLLVLIGYAIGRRTDKGEPWLDAQRAYDWLMQRWDRWR